MNKKVVCIYQIKSRKTGALYIGSTIDYKKRVYCHLYYLKTKKHQNQRLQNHVNKYGKEDLVFSILEIVVGLKELLLKREQFYLDAFSPSFNILKIAGSPLGTKHTEETKAKLRAMKIGVSVNLGNRHTEETKKKIGAANGGRKRSMESRMKMRMCHLGVGKGMRHIEYIKESIRLKTKNQTQLASELNIHQSTISKMLRA